MIIASIYIMYVAVTYLLSKPKDKKLRFALKTFFRVLTILLFLIYIANSIKLLVTNIKDNKYRNELEHLKYISISDGLYKQIVAVDEFILEMEKQGKEVIILDSSASIFNIPLDRYYKNYDMFNLGNLGSRAEEGIIEELNNKEDILMLVLRKEYKTNWQTPVKVIDYITENFEYLGDIERFSIYRK